MDAQAKLIGIKREVMAKIATAVKKDDALAVVSLGRQLEKIEQLIARQVELDRAISTLEGTGGGETASAKLDLLPGSPEMAETLKEKGMRMRREFIGILPPNLRPVGTVTGAAFKTQSGFRIGIACASEVKKNRWFLGLQERAFDHAILLCESNEGTTMFFTLSKDFLHRNGKTLSRRNGQIKFNVLRDNAEYFLAIPRMERVSIEQYRNNFNSLG